MTAAASPAAPPATPERKATTYVVLRLADDRDTIDVTKMGDPWEIVAKDIGAANSDAAIRKATDGKGKEPAGTFVAIPARSWQPKKIQATTKTVITLQDA